MEVMHKNVINLIEGFGSHICNDGTQYQGVR